ncbi:MAG: FAD-binding oxidoreductase [Thermoplasmataceae archaeon]
MRVPVLYGNDIAKDFSSEFEFASRKIGKNGEKWDGNFQISADFENMFPSKIPLQLIGETGVVLDPAKRLSHSIGKSSPEILRAKHGKIDSVVAGVLYPSPDNIEAYLRKIHEAGLLIIPYGGGSSVNGSLIPADGKITISVDMKNFSHIIMGKNYVSAGSGVLGSDLESALQKAGYTCGNYPESLHYSTVGGWISTAAVGQESNQYGGISEIALSVSLLTSSGRIEDVNVPSQSIGTTALAASLGASGSTGIITDVTLKIFRLPNRRYYQSYFFRSFEEGIEALEAWDGFPTVARLLDETETEFAIRSNQSGFLQRLFYRYLHARGVGNGSMLIVVNNNLPWKAGMPGSVNAGSFPAKVWERDRFLRPGLANSLWKAGYIPDTLETAANWEFLPGLHRDVLDTFSGMREEHGFNGVIMAHVSHLYRTGACIYFTFVISTEFDREMETLNAVRDAIMRAFLRNHGSITHHHGMGSLFKPYLDSSHSGLAHRLRDPMYGGI